MGVLACDRRDCENIMCDLLSDRYGYICHECFDELCKVYPDTGIAEFMNSPKDFNSLSEDETREILSRTFTIRGVE